MISSPVGHTRTLQLVDVTTNRVFKSGLRASCSKCMATQLLERFRPWGQRVSIPRCPPSFMRPSATPFSLACRLLLASLTPRQMTPLGSFFQVGHAQLVFASNFCVPVDPGLIFEPDSRGDGRGAVRRRGPRGTPGARASTTRYGGSTTSSQ